MGRREVGLLCLCAWLCCATATGCEVGYYWHKDERFDTSYCRPCSKKTPRCTRCVQNGGRCTRCSDNFRPPNCTDCVDGYYRLMNFLCVRCESSCKSGFCDPVSGKCPEDCEDGYYRYNDGWSDTYTCRLCFKKTPRCTKCLQNGGLCTQCSGHFRPPSCTDCEDEYYKLGFSCVPCRSYCKSGLCDLAGGKCAEVCRDGFYRYNNEWADLSYCRKCSKKTPRCTQCLQNGGRCTKCSGHFRPPDCADTPQVDKASFFKGPVFGGFLGCAVIMALICTAVARCRRKSSRNAGNPSATEMSSPAPALNLSNSAIQRSNPPPPASSTAGVSANVYIIGNDNNRTNGRLWPSAPPPYSSAVGNVHETIANDIHRTNGRLWSSAPPPYSSAVGVWGNVHETVDNDNDRTNGGLWQSAPPPYSSVVDVGRATSV